MQLLEHVKEQGQTRTMIERDRNCFGRQIRKDKADKKRYGKDRDTDTHVAPKDI